VFSYDVTILRESAKRDLYSWNSMGPTPTRTLGMRLSCNFVNGYTISYRVQYKFTRVHARIPNGHPCEKKRSCWTSRRGSLPDMPTSARAVARRLPCEDSHVEVGKDVRVGPVEFNLNSTHQLGCVAQNIGRSRCMQHLCCRSVVF